MFKSKQCDLVVEMIFVFNNGVLIQSLQLYLLED